MAKLKLVQSGNWVLLEGPYIKGFIDFLKYGIRPMAFREYDDKTKQWKIYWDRLPVIIHAARKYYEEVDWSELPPAWQMFAVGEEVNQSTELTLAEAYKVLHLLESAPPSVTKAVYKEMCILHHPDLGGNEKKMILINQAYGIIEEFNKKII